LQLRGVKKAQLSMIVVHIGNDKGSRSASIAYPPTVLN
jgi:hypothetical protein